MESDEASNNSEVERGSAEVLTNSFNTIRKACYLVGVNLFSLHGKLNIRIVGSVLLMVLIYVMCFYTGWMLRDDWYRVLEPFLIFVLNIQGSNKIWIGIAHVDRYYQLFRTSEEIYATFDGDRRNQPILTDTVAKMLILLKGMVIVYTLAGALIIIAVILFSLITGEKLMLISIYIPYIDFTTFYGYIITTLVHMILIAYCVNGYLASDTAFVGIVVPIIAYANSFKNEIENFNLLLGVPERDEKLIAKKLERLINLHKMIIEFEQDAIEHFKNGCLVQIVVQAGTILLCIFLGYIRNYAQAFSVLLAIFFQVTQYCALGTIVTAKNDQMVDDIYVIGWHLLDKSQQLNVKFMLHRAQNARGLSVGGMAPLNMDTYVQIMKTTYSFLAMLITMLDFMD